MLSLFSAYTTSLSHRPNRWIQSFLGGRKIGYKIILGYALVLGISTIGTATGLILGNIQEKNAALQYLVCQFNN
ncbi:hypothetical protein H6G20_22470 [Desertifilum sp. FACHB-1129]|uniref:Uncharacterized protein n=1 Tax=Desertifilum tharense IPPAS B-1220 TaxID=1781255 RepID=A0A1E5QI77_9CYAN|nr:MULTISPECIES: hypothetical protein [Desertifilum]MDA0212077.1 hypothetical protein [Cyanobacteria bacterium FC1]MBD2314440.1 hypothetical protein [Desertifilum sp. FACHB-1129]MBD2324865.1 hypothetical protein [Desertifilum sp. FACHB-866]MBD2334957.1 hypothetical protein [Desertifilum sp. FACHB-868]OEJ74294.1 hypothetical protein BH720_15050 [Desertifilum tharense IPPAS B-1220]